MVLWRISTQTKKYKADDISGKGAQLVGGRWNQVGTPMLYCAQHISIACLETMAHLNAELLWMDRYLVRVEVPDGLARHFTFPQNADPPLRWHANPYEEKSLGIILPSSFIQEENIVCLNPFHPRYLDVKATVVRKWQYDERIVRIE